MVAGVRSREHFVSSAASIRDEICQSPTRKCLCCSVVYSEPSKVCGRSGRSEELLPQYLHTARWGAVPPRFGEAKENKIAP